MNNTDGLAFGVVVGLSVLAAGCAVEFTEPPADRLASETSTELRWETNRTAASVVQLTGEGVDRAFELPAATEHMVVLEDLEPGVLYWAEVVSSNRFSSATSTWPVVVPDKLALLLSPDSDWVSGKVLVTAAPGDSTLEPTLADFHFRPVDTEPWVLIGRDEDGAGNLSNTFQPAPTGDGWSFEWDTEGLDEGFYELRTVLHTRLGTYKAEKQVYLDPEPPIAQLEEPQAGAPIDGIISIIATPGNGARAVFQQRRGNVTYSLPGRSLKQRDYPFDPNNSSGLPGDGSSMCDPTSEAAILWSYPDVRRRLHPNTLRDLIRYLAGAKGTTRPNGTTQVGEATGWRKLGRLLGGVWGCQQIGTVAKPISLVILKRKLEQLRRQNKLKGLMVHIKPTGRPRDPGHLMVVKNIVDRANGTASMTFMDPATGQDITRDVSAQGQLDYGNPAASHQMQWGTVFTGPTNAQPGVSGSSGGGMAILWDAIRSDLRPDAAFAQPLPHVPDTEGWQTIGVDDDSSDGWRASWDTTALEPGPWWIRVTVFDPERHQDSDAVEFWVR